MAAVTPAWFWGDEIHECPLAVAVEVEVAVEVGVVSFWGVAPAVVQTRVVVAVAAASRTNSHREGVAGVVVVVHGDSFFD